MRPTIKDVARLAGVSPATVSHALSGKRSVSRGTVERVQDAIAELGYRPNPIASSMITGRTSTLGLLVPDISNPFFGQLVAAIERTAGTHGIAVLVASSELDPDLEASHSRALVDRQVDALIYAGGTPQPNPEILNPQEDLPPIVFIDEMFDWIPEGAGTVSIDNEQGGRIAAEHLIALGHRNVMAITGPRGLPTAHSRTEPFRRAFLDDDPAGGPAFEANVPGAAHVEVVHADAYTIDAGYQVGRSVLGRWSAEGDGVPTALYCTNDLLACGVLRAAKELRLRVPQDVSVVSFDDTFVCELTDPALTSISQPLTEMGRQAAETAIALVNRGAKITGQAPSASRNGLPGTPSDNERPGQLASQSNADGEQPWKTSLDVRIVVRESTAPAQTSQRTPTDRAAGGANHRTADHTNAHLVKGNQ